MNKKGLYFIFYRSPFLIAISIFIFAEFFTFSLPAFSATPTLTLKANPTSIKKGEYVSLAWSAVGADHCSVSGGWIAPVIRTYGSTTLTPEKSTEYAMSCSGPDGVATASVSITVSDTTTPPPASSPQTPVANITANKSSIVRGETALLTWSSTGAQSCFATGGWTGARGFTGSENIAPTINTTYTLTCNNGPHSASDSELIQVRESAVPPSSESLPFTVACVASPSRAKINETIIFAAGSTGGILPISYEWSGVLAGTGLNRSLAFSSAGSKTAIVTATDAAGKNTRASCSAEIIAITPAQTATPAPSVSLVSAPQKTAEIRDDDALCIARGYIKPDTDIADKNPAPTAAKETSDHDKRTRLTAFILGEYIPLPLLFLLYLFAIGGIAASIFFALEKKRALRAEKK